MSVRNWLLAARPKTLVAAIVPVAVGAAVAQSLGSLRSGPTAAALLAAMCIQIGTNFANDVFDFERGADDELRVGPLRAVQAGLLTRSQMRRGMWLAFLFAATAGLWVVRAGGWPMVLIGVVSIAAGIGYTAGPYPLAYNSLGDLFVFVFFGLVAVCGTAYLNLGTVPPLAILAAIPVGGLSTAILVVNNVRDRVSDAAVGKVTTVVRWGRIGGVRLYRILVISAFATPVLAVFVSPSSSPKSMLLLLPLMTAPLAVRLGREVGAKEGGELNEVLVATARLLAAFGFLWSSGIALQANLLP